MYCKHCHKRIDQNIINCPYCGFNNSNDFEIGKTTELDLRLINGYKEPPNKHKANPKFITVIAILLIGSALGITYLLRDSKANDEKYYTTTTTNEITSTKAYSIGDFKFYYTPEFSKDNNTLYLNENNSININYNVIDDTEYYEILNNHETLDTALNTIDAKTYAEDGKYGYLIDYNKKKYHIVINYTSDISEEVQASINKILKSITVK